MRKYDGISMNGANNKEIRKIYRTKKYRRGPLPRSFTSNYEWWLARLLFLLITTTRKAASSFHFYVFSSTIFRTQPNPLFDKLLSTNVALGIINDN